MTNKGFIGILPIFLTAVALALGGGYLARRQITQSACNIISQKSDELDRDHCIKAVAVTLRDANLCGDIKGEEFVSEYQGKRVQLENPPKMECLTEVAAETNNPSLCNKVEGVFIANTKIDCLYRVAAVNKNPSICNLIGSENQSRVGMLMDQAGCKTQLGKVPPQTQITANQEPKAENLEPTIDKKEVKGECKYDTDCQPICEGNTRWKRGCDPQTNTCIKTFSDDCTSQKDTICREGECVKDIKTIDLKKQDAKELKTELSDQVKQLTAARQELTQTMLDANKNCLSALADVTNKLIIDSAVKLGMLPKSLWDVTSDLTNSLLDTLWSDPKRMSAEELISYNCNLYKSLQTDLDVLEKKINQAQDQYRQINSALNENE